MIQTLTANQNPADSSSAKAFKMADNITSACAYNKQCYRLFGVNYNVVIVYSVNEPLEFDNHSIIYLNLLSVSIFLTQNILPHRHTHTSQIDTLTS